MFLDRRLLELGRTIYMDLLDKNELTYEFVPSVDKDDVDFVAAVLHLNPYTISDIEQEMFQDPTLSAPARTIDKATE